MLFVLFLILIPLFGTLLGVLFGFFITANVIFLYAFLDFLLTKHEDSVEP